MNCLLYNCYLFACIRIHFSLPLIIRLSSSAQCVHCIDLYQRNTYLQAVKEYLLSVFALTITSRYKSWLLYLPLVTRRDLHCGLNSLVTATES
jgi:hypothetical protein